MNKSVTCIYLLVASFGVFGCTGAAPEPSDEQVDRSSAALTIAPRSEGAGFFHSFAHSKFHVGANPTNAAHLGFSKVVGSEGSFAVDPRNGSVRAILNGDSPTLTGFKPLTTDPAIHNARTVAYFKAAGLPPDQIGDVTVMSGRRGGSSATGSVQDEFTDYATIVHRVVAGFRAPDSYAWAIFNANDEVVQEGVHWPAIPDAVIAEARAVQGTLNDPSQHAAFKARLPPEATAEAGQVVIRHGGVAEADPSPFASYDVFIKARGSRGGVSHFDITGKQRIHPSSKTSGPDAIKK
jgi:hypothetical protein